MAVGLRLVDRPQNRMLHTNSPAEPATAIRIRDVATELFYEKGYHGTSMREIAAYVGIKPASLYNHFASKHDILYEIAFGTMQEMFTGAQAAIASAASPEGQLRRLVEFHVRYSATNRLRAKVADDQLHAIADEQKGSVLDLRDRYESLFRDVLRRGADECGWHIDDVPVVTFAIATMASAVGVWYRDDGRLSADAIASIYGDLAIRAVVGT
ncbi:MAG TPA: TetR/AcrR family transcriptional regulator [Solirubrobacteraceae bacterium]|nr:TetR/AcrR family transcriptional regulator [Solirubrobacteraceae bacterium]